MKLFTYQKDQRQAVGILQGKMVVDLEQAGDWYERETHTYLFPAREINSGLLALIRLGDGAWSGLTSLLAWLEQQEQPYPQGVMLEPAGVRLLAPIRNPSKIVCVGLNYRDHCRETGTPHGVGFSRTPPVYLSPGDEIEVEIQGLGILRNHVV
jgi:2-keto-4-pentenoate hydratase/2-oxohepta-3-ene-1,7-dioic acid hydratase in catechol pathway